METFAQLEARKPTCDCEEHHVEDCPVPQWEMDYWAHYFGQDHGTKEEKHRRLMAMDPRKNPTPHDDCEICQ